MNNNNPETLCPIYTFYLLIKHVYISYVTLTKLSKI